jgi:hypothetical protein
VHRGSSDHFAEVVITGTAIARFTSTGSAGAVPKLAVLPLGQLNGDDSLNPGRKKSR